MLNREVLVRTKKDLFKAIVVGWWEDSQGEGPVVRTSSGRCFDISMLRITKFVDTDEIPIWEADI